MGKVLLRHFLYPSLCYIARPLRSLDMLRNNLSCHPHTTALKLLHLQYTVLRPRCFQQQNSWIFLHTGLQNKAIIEGNELKVIDTVEMILYTNFSSKKQWSIKQEWEALATGSTQSPPQPSRDSPTHHRGWQHGAVHAYHTSFEASLQPRLDPASQALLASQQGPHASRSFTTIPYNTDTQYPTHLFRILMLRRLRLPIPLTARHCRCRRTLDTYGDHRAACAQSGILRNRSTPLERAAARMCREAGARVTTNTLLTDLNLDHIHRQDDRRIEVIANGLPIWGGAQLAVDTTIVSPLTRDGQPRRRAGQYAGTALTEARRRKERTYPELMRNRRCRLVVLGIETGGRWSEEAASFVKLLAHAKARQAPRLLQHSVASALTNRWTALLTHAALQAFAASLLDQDCTHLTSVEGNDPLWSQLLAEAPAPPPKPSRLPAPR